MINKIIPYVFFPFAAAYILFAAIFIGWKFHQDSIDEQNGIEICKDARYIQTNHILSNIDEVECFISPEKGKKIIYAEAGSKWILSEH